MGVDGALVTGGGIAEIDAEIARAIERRGTLRRTPQLFTWDAAPADLLDGGFCLRWPADERIGMDGPGAVRWRGTLLVMIATAVDPGAQLAALQTAALREGEVAAAIVPGPDDGCIVESVWGSEPRRRRRQQVSRWLLTEYEFSIEWSEQLR